MTLPNREHEKFFLNLVKEKKILVFPNGKVKNTKTKRFIGYTTQKGYRAIGWKINGKLKHILIHRLMWLVYKGEIPNKLQINHEDGKKTNNKLTNFTLKTNKENVIHAYKNGLVDIETQKLMAVLNCKTRKLNELQAKRVLVLKQKYSYDKLAKMFNVSKSIIRDIVKGYTYKWI